MAPAPTERASLPRPRVEEPIGVPTPSEPTTSEQEEATQPEEFALVPRRRPLAPPEFTLSWADESGPPPLEEADWPMSIPLGAKLDLTPWGPCR